MPPRLSHSRSVARLRLFLPRQLGQGSFPTRCGFFGDDLKKGILCAVIFPLTLSVIMLVREFIIPRRRKKAAS